MTPFHSRVIEGELYSTFYGRQGKVTHCMGFYVITGLNSIHTSGHFRFSNPLACFFVTYCGRRRVQHVNVSKGGNKIQDLLAVR